MPRLVRTFVVIAGSSVLVAAWAQSPLDVVEVVLLSGPHAGTYQTPSSETVCMHSKKHSFTTASWRDFGKHDPKKMSEAGIKVDNPNQAGPKRGDVRIAFGDPDKKPVLYSVTQGPVTITTKGKSADFSFDGTTTEGIRLRVNAKCSVVEEL